MLMYIVYPLYSQTIKHCLAKVLSYKKLMNKMTQQINASTPTINLFLLK